MPILEQYRASSEGGLIIYLCLSRAARIISFQPSQYVTEGEEILVTIDGFGQSEWKV